jgi:PAS domain S-box-containing protein
LPNQGSKAPGDILRLIANNLAEMVMAYAMDRRLVFVNPAVETLTGYSTVELEKVNFICWTHPEDQPRMLSLWEGLFEGRSFHEEEYRLITKDGRMKWAVSWWTPVFDDQGRQVGVQGARSKSRSGNSPRQRGATPRKSCAPTNSGTGRCLRTRRFPCGKRTSRKCGAISAC